MSNPLQTTSWHSYPKIYNVGHRALQDYFDGPVTIEEKVDGSQFSFGVFGGEIRCRSKGQELFVDAPEKMFARAVASVQEIAHLLKDGWTYRAEYLSSPKHNTLKYDRIPKLHLIIFDINPEQEGYLLWEDKANEADRIGLEVVPRISSGVHGHDDVASLMDRDSILGGTKIEGLVCKRYDRFGADGKVLLAKHVSEAFKEVHGKEWKKSNPTTGDVIMDLAKRLQAEGRWSKAVQRMKERGDLTSSPKDISLLINEVWDDIRNECTDMIIKELLHYAMPIIDRVAVTGLPNWYKDKLLESQFDAADDEVTDESSSRQPTTNTGVGR